MSRRGGRYVDLLRHKQPTEESKSVVFVELSDFAVAMSAQSGLRSRVGHRTISVWCCKRKLRCKYLGVSAGER